MEHRQCARHIFANFSKRYTGLELKHLFWDAAKATVEGDFLANMEKIRTITEAGYLHLMKRKPHTWSRCYFSAGFACDALENGISESFNSMIIHMRKKPLITMLEEIRIYLMDRFFHQSQILTTWRGDYGPNTMAKVAEFGKDMRYFYFSLLKLIKCNTNYACSDCRLWKVIPSGGRLFETRYGYNGYKVDLDAHTCTCHLWDLAGIPCVHGQAAINYIHRDPREFISIWVP